MDTKERLLNKLLSGLNAIRMLFSGCWDTFLIAGLVFSLLCGGVWYARRWMPPEERTVRQKVVHTAEYWLGVNEADGSHHEIIDLYNSHEPSPRDYQVTYEDTGALPLAAPLPCRQVWTA